MVTFFGCKPSVSAALYFTVRVAYRLRVRASTVLTVEDTYIASVKPFYSAHLNVPSLLPPSRRRRSLSSTDAHTHAHTGGGGGGGGGGSGGGAHDGQAGGGEGGSRDGRAQDGHVLSGSDGDRAAHYGAGGIGGGRRELLQVGLMQQQAYALRVGTTQIVWNITAAADSVYSNYSLRVRRANFAHALKP
jgi:hypothetical protein